MEKSLLIEWGNHIQFKDSLQFLPSSLERLVETLKTTQEDKFHSLKEAFPTATDEQLILLKQKGIFPYDWMDSKEKLDEDHLPPQIEFNSILRNEACSDEDYKRANDVWKSFDFRSFQNYMEHYLNCMIGFLIIYPINFIIPLYMAIFNIII